MSDDPTQQGEDPTDEVIDLNTLNEDQLRAHYAELSTTIDELSQGPLTPAVAAQINELRSERNDVVNAVNELVTFTPVEEAELAPVDVTPEETATEVVAEDTPTTTEEITVSDTTPAPEGPSDEVVAAAEAIVEGSAPEMAAVAASAGRPTAPTAAERPPVAYVAAAGQRAYQQGEELDWTSMARAFDSIKGLKPGVDGTEVRAVVASLPSFDDTPEALGGVAMLTIGNTTVQNDALIAETVEGFNAKRAARIAGVEFVPASAHVAAICTPLDIIREIPMCGETDTRFTDLFPQRPIGRLGFTFTRGSAIADVDDAITSIDIDTFEAALDEGDTATWKPCIPIDCATPDTVTAEELVTCVTVQDSTMMSSPERVQEFLHKVRVQRARRREQLQLTRWDATASGYNHATDNGIGAVPTFVQAVETLIPQLAYPERLDETDWDIVIEPGYLNKLTIDLHMVCNPVELAAARADTLAMLRNLTGRPIVVLRDFKGANPFQTQPEAGAEDDLDALPATDRIRMVPASAYIYGSTGEEQTGWQVDPQLLRMNRKQMFSAEYFLLAKHGCHPAAYIDITSYGSGGRAGCVNPTNFSDES
jgi:hypothetical protein